MKYRLVVHTESIRSDGELRELGTRLAALNVPRDVVEAVYHGKSASFETPGIAKTTYEITPIDGKEC